MDGGSMADLTSQLRLQAARAAAPASMGGLRAAMARAAATLDLQTGPLDRPTTVGPSLQTPARRRSRRYAERQRHLHPVG